MSIGILPPEEARKIAAGEVVDRPASLVRELLDNAIDAESGFIEVNIEEGGVRAVEVIDDGCGMTREDVELCWYNHATSKIRSLDDLNRAETLGFRGEALAAAAAVSALDILTSTDGREAWRLEVGPGDSRPPRLERARRVKGTSIRCFGLFDTIPARKRFLKREGSEAALCYQTFVEKAMAFPAAGFRFTQNNKVKTMLNGAASLRDRFAELMLDKSEAAFLHEISTSGSGFSVNIVIGGGELARATRKLQFVFANGRRIQEYSFLQAIEYGMQGSFPNGSHPVGALFIDVAPHLADFNIHPAKREARFTNLDAIHHAITSALRDFSRHQRRYTAYTADEAQRTEALPSASENAPEQEFAWTGEPSHEEKGEHTEPRYAPHYSAARKTARNESFCVFEKDASYRGGGATGDASGTAAMAREALLETSPRLTDPPGRSGAALEDAGVHAVAREKRTVRYVGRVFDLFIIVEKDETLFLVDQHAAHERILYNEFINAPIPTQELLVSIPFATESTVDDRFLESRKQDLARLGIGIEHDEGSSGKWFIEALPVRWRLSDGDTVKAILDLKQAGENITERWAATLACHAAIKDGDYLDAEAARTLAEAALSLPDPRCPHGRPVWTEISRKELFQAVKRM
ncbi:MAG: DNA mismatch repair endonuclease MutL [Treponema sp.]|jgi:DNA mismatch repair protein MutL|nr:DNA mismatch repair endonuclease MutL [Treponema sp.]